MDLRFVYVYISEYFVNNEMAMKFNLNQTKKKKKKTKKKKNLI